MTESSSNNSGSTPDATIYDRLSQIYGCWGIKSIDGWAVFVDEWVKNDGPEGAMDNVVVVINTGTRSFTAWRKEIFNNER